MTLLFIVEIGEIAAHQSGVTLEECCGCIPVSDTDWSCCGWVMTGLNEPDKLEVWDEWDEPLSDNFLAPPCSVRTAKWNHEEKGMRVSEYETMEFVLSKPDTKLASELGERLSKEHKSSDLFLERVKWLWSEAWLLFLGTQVQRSFCQPEKSDNKVGKAEVIK